MQCSKCTPFASILINFNTFDPLSAAHGWNISLKYKKCHIL